MRADQLDQLDDTARHVRQDLLANAHLFADPSSYRAGVDDALEGLLASDGQPAAEAADPTEIAQ